MFLIRAGCCWSIAELRLLVKVSGMKLCGRFRGTYSGVGGARTISRDRVLEEHTPWCKIGFCLKQTFRCSCRCYLGLAGICSTRNHSKCLICLKLPISKVWVFKNMGLPNTGDLLRSAHGSRCLSNILISFPSGTLHQSLGRIDRDYSRLGGVFCAIREAYFARSAVAIP